MMTSDHPHQGGVLFATVLSMPTLVDPYKPFGGSLAFGTEWILCDLPHLPILSLGGGWYGRVHAPC